MTIRPVGPGINSWEALSPLLNEMRDALNALQTPQGPVLAWATESADLPSATGFDNCVALVTDLDTLAYSDGANWIRVDTGSPI